MKWKCFTRVYNVHDAHLTATHRWIKFNKNLTIFCTRVCAFQPILRLSLSLLLFLSVTPILWFTFVLSQSCARQMIVRCNISKSKGIGAAAEAARSWVVIWTTEFVAMQCSVMCPTEPMRSMCRKMCDEHRVIPRKSIMTIIQWYLEYSCTRASVAVAAAAAVNSVYFDQSAFIIH